MCQDESVWQGHLLVHCSKSEKTIQKVFLSCNRDHFSVLKRRKRNKFEKNIKKKIDSFL